MEIEPKTTARWVFHGRVQGVGFRYTASRIARSLGLIGYVRNLPDGCVEVCAQGTPEKLQSAMTRLRSNFDITEVERAAAEALPSVSGFDIRR